MRWIIAKELRENPEAAAAGLTWLRDFLGQYDTRRLDWVRVDLGRGRFHGEYGRCWYPTRQPKKGYRISIQVPGPFPHDRANIRLHPAYQNADGSWPALDEPGVEYSEPITKNGRTWRRRYTTVHMPSLSAAIVLVGAHEAHHFLRHSKQIPGINREAEADAFSVARMQEFLANATMRV